MKKNESPKKLQGEVILESLNTILQRCEKAGIRLGYPGEGGERPFRAWLVSDFLAGVFNWPTDKIVVGERFDILLQDSESFPVITIETKMPYRKASKKEHEDFEKRLSGYGTLRTAYFTNGSEWKRLDIFSPTGILEIRERFKLHLPSTAEEAEAFFAPLSAERYFGGSPRYSRHAVTKEFPHVLEALAADFHQLIGEGTVFLESLLNGLCQGKAGEQARGIALSLFNLWCEKSLIVSPNTAAKRFVHYFSKKSPSIRAITKLVTELGLVGADIQSLSETLERLPRHQRSGATLLEALWPGYGSTVKKLCAQTSHVLLARALLYRIGEDQNVFPRYLSGEDMEQVLAKRKPSVLDIPQPATDLLSRIRLSMENFLPTVYKLGEFDWWLVTAEKRAILKPSQRLWLEETGKDFERLNRQLLRILDAYFFGRVDVDVWRNVYQHYLPADERQKLGGFYTPDDIVNLVLDLSDFTVHAEDLCCLSFIDQACGSGAFSTEALARLLKHLELDLKCHANIKGRGIPEWKQAELILKIVRNNLHSVDIHPFAAFLTTLNVLFILMPLYVKVRQKNPSFSLDLQIFSSDSLEKHDEDLLTPDLFTKLNSRVQLTEESFRHYQDMLQMRFDRVFGNPPWGGVLKGSLAPVYDTNKKERFALEYPAAATGKYDIYGLFIERTLQILKPGGRFGLVTQGTFIDKEWAAGLRGLLASNCRLRYIVDLNPFGQLFFHAMNTPCISIADSAVDVDESVECVAVLSKIPQNFQGMSETGRRTLVESTIREAINIVSRQKKSGEVGFAHASKISHRRLRETAMGRWNLEADEDIRVIPKGWMTAADVLEMRQGVTPGGCLELFLMTSQEANNLGIERSLVHRAIKSKEIERWRVSWDKLILFYPYHLSGDDATPAFAIDLATVENEELSDALRRLEIKDALDFDKTLDRREHDIVGRKGVNKNTISELLKHRDSLGLVSYPIAATYLINNYEILEGRVFKKKNIRDFNRRWYEYLWPRDPKLMLSKKRIVSPTLIKEVRFAIDSVGYMSDHACLFLQPTNKTHKYYMKLRDQLSAVLGSQVDSEETLMYCLAFLNSTYAQDRLVSGHRPTPKGFYTLTEDYLQELPIPPPRDKTVTKTIIRLVSQLTNNKEDKTERLEADLGKITNRLLESSKGASLPKR